MNNEPTKHEVQILREIAGELPASPWGAWVGACYEGLRGLGFIYKTGQLTDKGKEWLKNNPQSKSA